MMMGTIILKFHTIAEKENVLQADLISMGINL